MVYDRLLKRNLSEALTAMEGYLSSYSGSSDMDRLYAIKADFQLMSDYWKRGFKDPQLPNLYDTLLRRLYVLYADVAMSFEGTSGGIRGSRGHVGTGTRTYAGREKEGDAPSAPSTDGRLV